MSQLSNAVMAVLAQDSKFCFVSVTFAGSTKKYLYKTSIQNLQPGDVCLVETTPGVYKSVTVEETHDYLDVELEESVSYKWIVNVVDTTEYDRIVAMEEDISKTLRNAQRRRMREQAASALINEFGSDVDIKALVRL